MSDDIKNNGTEDMQDTGTDVAVAGGGDDGGPLNMQGVSAISIVDEMRKSYLDYAMSVIVSRALPDVRDGLKPVQRRILYAQKELGNEWNRPYKKSARVVGDVMGKYHPHGDSAIYDALVRLAQDFSMRVQLQDGQGNFGSMDGDNAAAMRYTETRMSRAASTLLTDIEKDTVTFRPNYDGNDMEPEVLPARYPNLLINGSGGIAVGMATNIPPHNPLEMIDATAFQIDNPECTTDELLGFVQGPDFPTGGIAMGRDGFKAAMMTGRGKVMMRGKTHVEEIRNKDALIITEIPYQVNKSRLIERIAELVRDKVIDGITHIQDESNREGVRVVIEIRRDASHEIVLNQLFKHTALQSSFSYNMLALDRGRPKLMGLKEILTCFINHRVDVVTRRTKFELGKARARAHVLVGLALAVANIDDVIKIVRNAPDPAAAKAELMARDFDAESVVSLIELLGEAMPNGKIYHMSEIQAQAILDLRLHRLTGLEREKIVQEATDISEVIEKLVEILSNRPVMMALIKEELMEMRDLLSLKGAAERRTEMQDGAATMDIEDLIKPEEMVVTISSDGYVKRQPMDAYRAQRRGGQGKSLANMKNEDEQVQEFLVANTHDPVFFFSSNGKVYKLKVWELPVASAGSRGKALINLLPIEKDERVLKVLPAPQDAEAWEGMVAMFATREGLVRKTPLNAFSNVHSGGIKGINLNDGDELVSVRICPEAEGDVFLCSKNGQAVRFPVETLRTIASRTAYGVKGMSLKAGDELVSMDVIVDKEADKYILSITENGFGKRTLAEDYPAKSRGTMGVISIKTSERNGPVTASLPVGDGDHIMIITTDGQVIRTTADGISCVGRNTQGVTIFKTKGAKASSVTRIPAHLMEEDEEAIEGEAVEGEVADETVVAASETAETPEAETTDA